MNVLKILLIILISFQKLYAADNFEGHVNIENAKFEDITLNGSGKFKNIIFKSLKIHGALEFDDLLIKNFIEIHGSMNGKKLKSDELIVYGSANLNNIDVTKTMIEGSLTGHQFTVHNHMNVNGNVNGKDFKLGGNAKIFGNVKLADSIMQDIEIDSEEASFDNCKISNVIVKKAKHNQTVILKNNSIILGNINFESGKGKIYADKSVKIKGKIKGAKLIRK